MSATRDLPGTRAQKVCPSCGSRRSRKIESAPKYSDVRSCVRCKAVFNTSPMYLGESYEIVLPQWDSEKSPVEIPYDLVVLGSNGIERRHGWFNPATKRITQTG